MKKVHSIFATAAFALAISLTPSCSGDGGGDDGSSSSIVPSSSSDIASSSSVPGGSSSSGGGALLLNFTSNYVNGRLFWMDVSSSSLGGSYLSFNQDSQVFANNDNGMIYVLERSTSGTTTNGYLNCLSLTTGSPVLMSPSHIQLAIGSNPYDIAFIGDKGYIAQYGIDSVQIFNTDDCSLVSGQIPLPSNIPVIYSSSSAPTTTNAVSIKTDGTDLYVVMQTWINYPTSSPSNGQPGNGALVRVNPNPGSGTRDSMLLNFYNPQSSVLSGNTIYIASTNNLDTAINGALSGIEYVSIGGSLVGKTSDTLTTGTRLNSGVDVGPTSMVLGNSVLWTIVYASWGNAIVQAIDISSGNVVYTVPTTSVNAASCLAYDSVSTNLFIGNGNPFTTYSLISWDLSSTPTTIGNSSAAPVYAPYSLAIVRW